MLWLVGVSLFQLVQVGTPLRESMIKSRTLNAISKSLITTKQALGLGFARDFVDSVPLSTTLRSGSTCHTRQPTVESP